MRVRYVKMLAPVALSIAGALSCEAPCADKGTCGPYEGGGAGSTGAEAGANAGGGSGRAGGSGTFAGADSGGAGEPGSGGTGGGEGGRTGSEGQAGAGGNGGEGGGEPVECDPTKSPDEAPCVLNDERAIFVSSKGSPDGTGTMSAPLGSLRKAIDLAVQNDKVVIACGTFVESVSVTAGVRLYGGYECKSGWVHGGGRTLVEAEAGKGPALIVDGVEESVVIDGFEFVSTVAEEPEPGESVVTAVVNDASDVRFLDVSLVAGSAVDATSAEPVTPFAARADAGNPANGPNGGARRLCPCEIGGNTTGGAGGDGDPDGIASDASEEKGVSGTPDRGGGKGGSVGQACSASGRGGDGLPPTEQKPFSEGARTLGAWDAQEGTWVPASGEVGENGSSGQGGGGGRGGGSTTDAPGDGGGGGGCGGCGGKGGGKGQGGGGSIALVLSNSTLVFESGEISTGKGGRGGSGAAGQAGQPGGLEGQGIGLACDGGAGAKGASGGAGGGGAGGISVGILYEGDEPHLTAAVTVHTEAAGEGGEGGDDSVTADDGIDGVSVPIHPL